MQPGSGSPVNCVPGPRLSDSAPVTRTNSSESLYLGMKGSIHLWPSTVFPFQHFRLSQRGNQHGLRSTCPHLRESLVKEHVKMWLASQGTEYKYLPPLSICYVYLHMGMCKYVCTHFTCQWRPEIDVRCLLNWSPTFFFFFSQSFGEPELNHQPD